MKSILRRKRSFSVLIALAITVGMLAAGCSTSTPEATGKTKCATGTLSYSFADSEAAAEKVGPGVEPSAVPTTKSLVRNANWKLLNKSTGELITSGVTDPKTGAFSACYDPSLASSAVKIQFESASSNLWRTVQANTEDAKTYTNEHELSAENFGALEVPANQAAAFKIVDTLSDLWVKRGNAKTACWTVKESEGQCTPITFAWGTGIDNNQSDGGKDTGYWDYSGTKEGTRYVVVGSNSIRSKHTIVHEAGHAWQYLLNAGFPEVTKCENHTFAEASSTTCAWTEAWADAVAAWTLGDTRYVYDSGKYTDLTTQSEWDKGAAVQGRVGAVLLQLWAGPDGGNWDKTITLMTGKVLSCFKDYYQARPAVGLGNDDGVQKILTDNSLDPQDQAKCE